MGGPKAKIVSVLRRNAGRISISMDLTRAAQLTGVAAMHEPMGGPPRRATLRKTGISLFAWAMALIVVAELTAGAAYAAWLTLTLLHLV
jgi:hypothetical protein